jgi:hypothetical protein
MYKEGDILICTDSNGCKSFTNGKKYIVENCDGYTFIIDDENRALMIEDLVYDSSPYFTLYTEELPPQDFSRYNLIDLCNSYLGEYIKPCKSNKKASIRPRTQQKLNKYTLSLERGRDILRLVEMRQGQVEGYRQRLLLFYGIFVIKYTDDSQSLFNELWKLNELFAEYQSQDDIEGIIASIERYRAEDKLYKITNQRLIKEFDITLAEQRFLKTIISTSEKYRRNNEKRKATRRNEEGLTRREQAKQDNKTLILKLYTEGETPLNIGERLHLSKRYVNKILKLGGIR